VADQVGDERLDEIECQSFVFKERSLTKLRYANYWILYTKNHDEIHHHMEIRKSNIPPLK
jgi:hypothetical protein